MKTVTLTNDFHNTQTRVRVGTLSARAVRRVRDNLCGSDGCTCSGPLGVRGRQDADVQPYGLYGYRVAEPGKVRGGAR